MWGLMAACQGGTAEKAAEETSERESAMDSAPSDDSVSTAPDANPPCDAGTSWGSIEQPESSLHVSAATGDDAGDGSPKQPLATVAAAVERAAGGAVRAIALWPGTYPATVTIGPNPDGTTAFDGISLTGCSRDEVTLEASSAVQEVLHVVGADSVVIRHLTLDGGTRALRASAGATGSFTDLRVTGASVASVVMDGVDTIVDASELVIGPTLSGPGDDGLGIGLVVEDADVDLTDISVSGSVGAGVLVDGDDAEVTMTTVDVSDSAPSAAGQFGRGIQVQGHALATLTGCEVRASADAGVFAILAPGFTLTGGMVEGVDAGVSDVGSTTGDGVVVTSRDGTGSYDPDDFPATVDGLTLSGWQAGRAAIYTEGVRLSASGNLAYGEAPFTAEDPAYVGGADAAGFVAGTLDLLHTGPSLEAVLP